jgi:hypothetical protein
MYPGDLQGFYDNTDVFVCSRWKHSCPSSVFCQSHEQMFFSFIGICVSSTSWVYSTPDEVVILPPLMAEAVYRPASSHKITSYFLNCLYHLCSTLYRSWLKRHATIESRRFECRWGYEIFVNWRNPSTCTMILWLTQPLTENSTRMLCERKSAAEA